MHPVSAGDKGGIHLPSIVDPFKARRLRQLFDPNGVFT
jgi:hypothetical protein